MAVEVRHFSPIIDVDGFPSGSALNRQLSLVEICESLDERGLTKREAYPLWIW